MPMKKGMNALELVFMMFILIVVTLVIIRLFTGVVKKDTLPDIKGFEQAYNYERESSRCASLCEAACKDPRSSVIYCREKVFIDINGDYKTGERKAYGVIGGIPYCEDGLYCFHIYNCECGFVTLDAKECLDLMKEYYLGETEDEATANLAVCKAIQPGECEKDPRLWHRKLPGYQPVIIQGGKYAGQIWGADYWWKKAGYADICGATTETTGTTIPGETTTIPTKTLSLSNCQLDKSTSPWSFKCNTNCIEADAVIVTDSNKLRSVEVSPSISSGKLLSQPSRENTLNNLKCPDTWTVFLACSNPDGEKESPLVCS